jgi:glycine/D-amino acid oxidase-like deaminating enzyme/Fe-S-cluster-containing hydrogenase component 2
MCDCKNSKLNNSLRISNHPVLPLKEKGKEVTFTCNGQTIKGIEGEPIIVSLRAANILKVRNSTKSHLPWGAFCMQGRCCSCLMTVDDNPNTMTCVTPLKEGMIVNSPSAAIDREFFRKLPSKTPDPEIEDKIKAGHEEYDVAVIGAGPAGLEAALMAAESGCKKVVLLDDKEYLGGQLMLQTHDFFGTEALGASKRGFEIARELEEAVLKHPSIKIRTNSTVVGIFPTNFLAFKDGNKLNFARGKKLIIATGASEKMIPFPGNYLPGIIGAGAAQTFMNIHGVRPGHRVLIVGGGNIGVILAYQLLQAGIEVVEVIEAGPKPGAYKVHVDKIKTLGVPVKTRHTIKAAIGTDRVEGAEIVELDENWNIIEGTSRIVKVDTICLAVGLSPLNELLWQAGVEFMNTPELGEVPSFSRYRRSSKPDIFIAGDCAVIGEASIARLEGRIAGLTASRDLGHRHNNFEDLVKESFLLLDAIQSGTFGERLGTGKARITGERRDSTFSPSKYHQEISEDRVSDPKKAVVLIECSQDIPCNPCELSCPFGAITIGKDINQQPDVDIEKCRGCGKCLFKCPGRAIRMIKFDAGQGKSEISFPYEFLPLPSIGEEIALTDRDGRIIGKGSVVHIRNGEDLNKCSILKVETDRDIVEEVRSALPPKPVVTESEEVVTESDEVTIKSDEVSNLPTPTEKPLDALVCRCEEVTLDQILTAINDGYTSLNEIKRILRCGMGPCRGLGCKCIIEGQLKACGNKSVEALLKVKQDRPMIFRPPTKRITLAEAARLSFTPEEIQKFVDIEEKRTIPQEEIDAFRWQEIPVQKVLKRKVVIIGGGVTGVLTAWWLAKQGWKDIVVVEKEFLSAGATGACLGGVRTGFAGANKVARAKKGLEIWRSAEDIIGHSVGWYQGGYVYLAFDDEQAENFRTTSKIWDEGDIPYEFLENEADILKYVPGADTSSIKLGVHFPESGGANPFLATFRFAEHAKTMGVEFLTGSEVMDIEISNNTIQGVRLGDGTAITCEHVVNAAGSFAVRVSSMVGINLAPDFWIERHGAFITEKLPLWLDSLIVSYHPTLSGYWQQKRMEPGVMEGEIVACYSAKDPIHGYNTNSSIYFLSRMAKSILKVQPNLGCVGIVRHSAHHYVGRKSGIPLIGPTEINGYWHNIAKKGHGFMCAPGDGFALASTMTEGKLHPWISECTLENSAGPETMK